LGEAIEIELNLKQFMQYHDINHEFIHRMVQNKIRLDENHQDYIKQGIIYELTDDFNSPKKRKSFDNQNEFCNESPKKINFQKIKEYSSRIRIK
jgi:hypothetical protein